MASIAQEYRKALQYLSQWKSGFAEKLDGLVDQRERPTGNELDYYVPLLASMMHHLDPSSPEGEAYRERLERVLSGKKILEVGARHGLFVDFLNMHGASASGLDFDENAAAPARSLGVPIETKNLHDLAEREKYDLILSHHFFDPHYFHSERSLTPSEESAKYINRLKQMGTHEKEIERLKPDFEKMAGNIARALKLGGVAIHTVVNVRESALDPKQLEDAGMQVLSQGVHEPAKGLFFHESISRRVR